MRDNNNTLSILQLNAQKSKNKVQIPLLADQRVQLYDIIAL